LAEFGDIRHCGNHAPDDFHGSSSVDDAEPSGGSVPTRASPRNEGSPDVCLSGGKGRVEDQRRRVRPQQHIGIAGPSDRPEETHGEAS
jgi:hypothetical protein